MGPWVGAGRLLESGALLPWVSTPGRVPAGSAASPALPMAFPSTDSAVVAADAEMPRDSLAAGDAVTAAPAVRFEAAFAAHQGGRPHMEDTAVVRRLSEDPSVHLMAVFDGHGAC